MKIEVKNLGVIGKGSLDSSKQLTLLCGHNSTGKTYLSYLIYTIFSNNYRVITPSYEIIKKLIDDNGSFRITKEYIDEFLEYEAAHIKANLDTIFALPENDASKLFRYFNLDLTLSEEDYSKAIQHTELSVNLRKDSTQFNFRKKRNSDVVEYRIISENDPIYEKFADIEMVSDYAVYTILHLISHAPVTHARMLTVERNSIYTFNRELSLSRNELINNILDIDTDKPESSIFNLIGAKSRRYPIAIRDSLRIANDLETLRKNKGDFYDYATIIEKNLLHGTVSVTKDGDLEFIPETTAKTKRKLPIHMTSSIVKTMVSLVFYLKHIAKKNDLVIIDEPEMNLHPDNQVILARVFARLVNHGLRMVISTHSDYIIREFNNLIMLNSLKKTEWKSIIEKRGYDYSELLSPRNMEVLYFRASNRGKIEVEQIEIDRYGFRIESIDETIQAQNRNSQYLYDTLTYGPEDE